MSWRSTKVQNSHLSTSGARGERGILNFSWASTHLNFFWTSLTLYSSELYIKSFIPCTSFRRKRQAISSLLFHHQRFSNSIFSRQNLSTKSSECKKLPIHTLSLKQIKSYLKQAYLGRVTVEVNSPGFNVNWPTYVAGWSWQRADSVCFACHSSGPIDVNPMLQYGNA